MLLTTYLDESGTHDQSPIMTMAGYLGTASQWAGFEADWDALLRNGGVQHVHAVDLFKRAKQFKGWRPEAVNCFALSLERVINKHLELGFSVVIRDDDYRSLYKTGARPKKLPQDTKYGLCFRACLAFVPSFIASELKAAEKRDLAKDMTINFCLEDGHRNVGDAKRLFELFKSDALPEWQNFVGTFDVVKKNSPGAQAADFLAYCTYRAELLEHGTEPTAIENSSYVADTPMIPNTYPSTSAPGSQLFRIPISRQILQDLKGDLFAREAEIRGA